MRWQGDSNVEGESIGQSIIHGIVGGGGELFHQEETHHTLM